MKIHNHIIKINGKVELLYDDEFSNLKKETFKPGQTELWHFHKINDQLFHSIVGILTIQTPNNTTELNPGDSILIKALTPHQVFNKSDNDVEFYLFSVGEGVHLDKYIIDLAPVNPNGIFYMQDDFLIEEFNEHNLKEFIELVNKNRPRLKDFPTTINAIDYNLFTTDFFTRKNIFPYLIKERGKIIGYLGLKNIKSYDRSVELGYWIDVDNEGKGLCSKLLHGFIYQLFIKAAFRKINVRVDPSNSRNLRLLQKLNFKLESTSELLNYQLTGQNYFLNFGDVQVIEYSPSYKKVFHDLNVEWITHHFSLEDNDRQVLDYPEENIINKGGNIFFVLVNGEAIATAALLQVNDEVFELIKMATNPVFRGLGLGNLLLEKVISWARGHFIKQLILYTQSSLFPALTLYNRYGFKEVPVEPGHYERADVKMVLDLK